MTVTYLSNGEFYTILTNKAAKGRKGGSEIKSRFPSFSQLWRVGLLRKYFDKTFKLTDQDWQIFSSKLTKQDFPKKHTLLKAGQIENNLSFIEAGIVRFYIPKEKTLFWRSC